MNMTWGPRARRAVATLAGLLALSTVVAMAAPAAAAPGAWGGPGAQTADPGAALARRLLADTRQLPAAAQRDARLRPACPAKAGHLHCFALFQPQYAVNRALASGHETHPSGWSATALERAYRLPVARHSHQTIAVSIAYRTPKLAQYLKVYREHYGLPPCTLGRGCLRIVNQQGKTKPAAPNGTGSGWDVEATLDVSMISAACPHCKILVVEGRSDGDDDLARTEDTAARLGAAVISNSYGQRENGSIMRYARDYQHHGHVTVASSGDSGFDAANFPANFAGVTAVGGTELRRARNPRGFTERVWFQPGILAAGTSSCSAYVKKPSWQHDPHCPGRTIADISAIAANVPIFNAAWGGWITVAGTSAAAPFIAGVYGLAGNARHLTPRHLYTHRHDFYDVTKGNNAIMWSTPRQACGNDYLCAAKKGYDAPTGLGTPHGTAGF
jgi:hypothetical protein